MDYVVVIEKTGNGYGAYVPDLPGCVAAADTREETEALIREAVGYHLEMLRESGDPVPEPQASASRVLKKEPPSELGSISPASPDTKLARRKSSIAPLSTFSAAC